MRAIPLRLRLTSLLLPFATSLWLSACDGVIPSAPGAREASASVGDDGIEAASFEGNATAVRASVLGITTQLVHAGPLPSGGGADGATLVTASIPGVLGAQLLHAATAGAGDGTQSDASLAGLSVNVGILSLSASFVRASASSICGSGSSGSSQIAALRINGKSIVVSGQPNQTIKLALGLGKVVINEQVASANGITVNALHIVLAGVADIVVAQATAGVTCGAPESCTDDDYVSGSGYTFGTPSGSRADVALIAGIDGNAQFFGHFEFNDASGVAVSGTSMTRYFFAGPRSRRIEGTATVNGQAGFTFILEVTDNPGASDSFVLTLSNGYSASGTFAGGDLQLISNLCPVDT